MPSSQWRQPFPSQTSRFPPAVSLGISRPCWLTCGETYTGSLKCWTNRLRARPTMTLSVTGAPTIQKPMLPESQNTLLKPAQTYRTGAELTRSFADISATCYGLTGKHAPDRLIEVWWGPRMRLDEFLKTRVLELVVHGIDMTDALRREPIATNEGLSITTRILRCSAGGHGSAQPRLDTA